MNDDRRYWDTHAKHYDLSMRLLGGPIPRIAALTRAAIAPGERVLEVAAGTGLFTGALAEHASEVVATDYSAPMVDALRARIAAAHISNVRCLQADIYSIQGALTDQTASASAGESSRPFDVIFAANVLHLLPDLPRALDALRYAVAPYGRLILPTYCHDETALSWSVSRLLAVTGFPGHRRFTAKRLALTLEASGLRVTRTEVVKGLLPMAFVEAIPAL